MSWPSASMWCARPSRSGSAAPRFPTPIRSWPWRELGVSAAELLGESAMWRKSRDLAWETLSSGRARYQRVATARSPRALPQMGAHRRGGYGAGLRTFVWLPNQQFLICDMVGQRG